MRRIRVARTVNGEWRVYVTPDLTVGDTVSFHDLRGTVREIRPNGDVVVSTTGRTIVTEPWLLRREAS